MTEEEWLVSDDVDLMIEHAEGFSTERHLRLFACACCRRIWQLLVDERSREAVRLAELYANGEISAEVLGAANKAAIAVWKERNQHNDDHAAAAAYFCSTLRPTLLPAAANRAQEAVANKDLERKSQAALLREIIGKPSNNQSSPTQ